MLCLGIAGVDDASCRRDNMPLRCGLFLHTALQSLSRNAPVGLLRGPGK